MTQLLPSFQQYQQAFCAHLRDPLCYPRPENVSLERMAVYQEIVFNNIFETISACFPVAQKILGKRSWLALCKRFMREHSANSPMFRVIPEEFLKFLSTKTLLTDHQKSLPAYLADLCHYEWVELLVSSMPDALSKYHHHTNSDNTDGLLNGYPIFNHTMQLLHYDFAVHQISSKHQQVKPTSTHLLVYRDAEDQVKFIALNATTYKLIELLKYTAKNGLQALKLIAETLRPLDTEATIQFGLDLLVRLKTQGVIIGVRSEPAQNDFG